MKSLVPSLLLLLSGSLAAHDPLAFASGSWFDPQRNGEGFVVQVLPEERAVVTWFTYPPAGEDGAQAWLIGEARVEGRTLWIKEMLITGGAWRRVADLDVATSESASAGLDGVVYTAGGYGHLQRLQRYDPAADSCQDLPALPGERHHPMMASDGQYIYVAGGYVGRFSTVTGDNFWRYDPLSDEWEILADSPGARAAGAAVFLHGRVWILGGVGVGLDMQSYDVQTGEWELFPGAIGVPADHMQAVAFENEIWWLGGRDDQTSKEVRIWNPVTRAWRVGPSLQFARAGFAAGVLQGQIMVTGGERTELVPFQLVPSMEIFAPGAAGWVPGPPPSIAVHGTTGAEVGGAFILVAGSTVAGTTSSNRVTQIYAPAEP